MQQVHAAAAAAPLGAVGAAIGLTALSLFSLALYDVLGVQVVAPGRVPHGTALLTGAIANAVSNTLGFHAVTGSLVRTRIYLRYGLSRAETVRVVALAWLSLGMGFLAMLALAEFARWRMASEAGPLLMAAAITSALALLVAWLGTGRRTLRIATFTQPLPDARRALLQMLVGVVESASAIGALYILLPADLSPAFGVFAIGYIAATGAGVLAHVPGGLGVFEASITAMLSGGGRADLLTALLLYRAIYNLLPFAASAVALGVLEYQCFRALNSRADTG